MTKEDVFRNYIGAYYGVRLMDEYDLKAYTLKNIENFIKEYVRLNPIPNFGYYEEANKVEKNVSNKVKLQDAINLLNTMNEAEELIYLIRKRLRLLSKEID